MLRRATAFNPSFANTYAKKSIPIPGCPRNALRAPRRDGTQVRHLFVRRVIDASSPPAYLTSGVRHRVEPATGFRFPRSAAAALTAAAIILQFR